MENIKKSYKNNKFKIAAPTWNEGLNYLMDHILNQIFKTILGIKKHETVTDDPSIMIYVNKIENRITFKIKTGYYFVPLMPETVKLLGNTKSKITKDENVENVLNLEIAEVILVYCNRSTTIIII